MNHASPISSSSYSYDSPGPSRNDAEPASVSRPTGLKLVLPPMKGGKLIKGTKRSAVSYGPSFVEVKKPQRPLKLKPLKEVLVRLISLIKK